VAAFDPEPILSWVATGLVSRSNASSCPLTFPTPAESGTTLGRSFGPQEIANWSRPVAWSATVLENSLGRDPQIVGPVLTINGISLTVGGVAPKGSRLWPGCRRFGAPYMMAPVVLHDPNGTRAQTLSAFRGGPL